LELRLKERQEQLRAGKTAACILFGALLLSSLLIIIAGKDYKPHQPPAVNAPTYPILPPATKNATGVPPSRLSNNTIWKLIVVFQTVFGYAQQSVSLSDDGTILAVGDPTYDYNSTMPKAGRAMVYQITDYGEWEQAFQAYQDIPHEGNVKGTSVALSGDGTTLGVGIPANDEQGTGLGSVQFYPSSSWSEGFERLPSLDSASFSGWTGETLAMSRSGNHIVVGSPLYGPNITYPCEWDTNQTCRWEQGLVRACSFYEDSWEQMAFVTGDTNYGLLGGASVGMTADGTRFIVTSTEDDSANAHVVGIENVNIFRSTNLTLTTPATMGYLLLLSFK